MTFSYVFHFQYLHIMHRYHISFHICFLPLQPLDLFFTVRWNNNNCSSQCSMSHNTNTSLLLLLLVPRLGIALNCIKCNFTQLWLQRTARHYYGRYLDICVALMQEIYSINQISSYNHSPVWSRSGSPLELSIADFKTPTRCESSHDKSGLNKIVRSATDGFLVQTFIDVVNGEGMTMNALVYIMK